MRLIIDGYNLLHSGRSLIKLNSIQLQWERERLVQKLSEYRQTRPCEMILVFDGWQGGWAMEQKEKKKGIELIYSKVGEKADEVIKRLIREKGAGAMVVTSDRDISKFAEKISVPVIPSDQFQERMERAAFHHEKEIEEEDEEERGLKRKGPSRILSKKDRRLKQALEDVVGALERAASALGPLRAAVTGRGSTQGRIAAPSPTRPSTRSCACSR